MAAMFSNLSDLKPVGVLLSRLPLLNGSIPKGSQCRRPHDLH
jgi:hypothetical protein